MNNLFGLPKDDDSVNAPINGLTFVRCPDCYRLMGFDDDARVWNNCEHLTQIDLDIAIAKEAEHEPQTPPTEE